MIVNATKTDVGIFKVFRESPTLFRKTSSKYALFLVTIQLADLNAFQNFMINRILSELRSDYPVQHSINQNVLFL